MCSKQCKKWLKWFLEEYWKLCLIFLIIVIELSMISLVIAAIDKFKNSLNVQREQETEITRTME